jgi:hypothetical protein
VTVTVQDAGEPWRSLREALLIAVVVAVVVWLVVRP